MPDAHAVLVLDGAGWHRPGGNLRVPANLTLLPLPRYAPELNPTENIWEYLRGNSLSNTVWQSYDEIVEACCHAWNWLIKTPKTINSIATLDWATQVIE